MQCRSSEDRCKLCVWVLMSVTSHIVTTTRLFHPKSEKYTLPIYMIITGNYILVCHAIHAANKHDLSACINMQQMVKGKTNEIGSPVSTQDFFQLQLQKKALLCHIPIGNMQNENMCKYLYSFSVQISPHEDCRANNTAILIRKLEPDYMDYLFPLKPPSCVYFKMYDVTFPVIHAGAR